MLFCTAAAPSERGGRTHATEQPYTGQRSQTLFRFACPFLVANVLQSLYGAADLFVVGAFCGAQSVAAVSTGTQVTQIVTSLVTGLTLGSTVIIGQYTGQGEYGKVKRAIGTTLTVFACVALALTAGMLAVLRPLLRLLQTPQPAFELAVQYVTVCMLGNLFICGYNAISAVLRGWGDSRRPMWFVGIACAINIVLDVVFVRFLGLDVAGHRNFSGCEHGPCCGVSAAASFFVRFPAAQLSAR